MMVEDNYQQLKADVFQHMIAQVKEGKKSWQVKMGKGRRSHQQEEK